VNPWPPLLRLMAAIVGLALGLRLAVELVRPVAGVLAIVAVSVSVLYLAWVVRGRRDRW
jgi:hypothetical protein